MSTSGISIVIPTFQRERILVETVRQLVALFKAQAEIIVVDQTERHERETTNFLRAHQENGVLRWLRLEQPSIPRAMNIGLQTASNETVLFLDDDIEPSPKLVAQHAAAHEEFPEAWAVAGQVVQPGEEVTPRNRWTPGRGFRADLDFPFYSTERAWVLSVMAGNLSVKRDHALHVGGFDESFQGVAYRFETEFCRRLTRAGGKVLFEPSASLRHLRAGYGGTRSIGSHLKSASPLHGMGDYYFALRSGLSVAVVWHILRRPVREVLTRFHFRHPWVIPLKLLGEFRAFGKAVRAIARGPRLLRVEDDVDVSRPSAAALKARNEAP